MDHARQVALMERFFDLHARRTTTLAPKSWRMPSEAYTSTKVLEREKAKLFRDRPLFVGLSGDVARPGDYMCLDLSGLPVVLIRSEDGSIRAHVNACRHRGMPVLEGRAKVGGRAFTCPFHAWTYDLNGRLLGQPLGQEGFADCEKEILGLHTVPAAEAYGLVFVAPPGRDSLDTDAVIDVPALLGGAQEELAEFDIASARFIEQRTRTLPLNWKLIVDTFLENYHVFSLHKQSIAPYFLSSPSVIDTYGDVGRFVGSRADILKYRDLPQSEWSLLRCASIQFLLPPNGILVHQYDHFETWHVYPGSHPGECTVTTTIYAPGHEDDKSDRYYTKNLDYLLAITDPEDFIAAQKSYDAMAGGGAAEVVFGRNESLLIHYHQVLERMLSGN